MRSAETWPADALFPLGATVQKKGRASWRGRIVGWYRTDLTALGFAVESTFEPGSVQIYPQSALTEWDGRTGTYAEGIEATAKHYEAKGLRDHAAAIRQLSPAKGGEG